MSIFPQTIKQMFLHIGLITGFSIIGDIFIPLQFQMVWGFAEGLIICVIIYGLNESFNTVNNSFKKGVIFGLEGFIKSGNAEVLDNGKILRITITNDREIKKGLHLVKPNKDKEVNKND